MFIDVQPETVREARSIKLMAVLFNDVIRYSTVRFFNGIPQGDMTGSRPAFAVHYHYGDSGDEPDKGPPCAWFNAPHGRAERHCNSRLLR
jgi:hypothetical protein